MNSSLQTRAIAEGGLMAVMTTLIALAGLYIPFMQFFIFFIWTIPSVIVIVRHGLTVGLISIAAASILIFMLAGPLSAIMAAIQIGSLALVYGYAFRNGWKAASTLLAGAIIMVGATLLLYYTVFLITGINNLNIFSQLNEVLEPTIEMYKNLGIIDPAKGITEGAVREIIQKYFQLLTYLFPAFFAMAGIASAYLNLFAAQKILHRFGIDVPILPQFRHWNLPWWVVWGLITGLGLNLAGKYWGNYIIEMLGSNIMLLYMPMLFILGLSVIMFYYHKYLSGQVIYRIMIPFLIFFMLPYSTMLLSILGLLDLFFNYRRLSGEN
ncbi:MAG: hypothetical protein CVU87_08340 [Firmicutes bacterium HGW-Firmicutes-12]|jgi:uncharacterized protein YybS (DUF2232 family)|nr:MAG: hypothetical protein CVU87_08340 [Firmicutes bacterium HGW-Firmicutes-12]